MLRAFGRARALALASRQRMLLAPVAVRITSTTHAGIAKASIRPTVAAFSVRAASNALSTPVRSFATAANVETQNLQLPALSPTMETGSIKDWVKKPGDTIKPGDVICNIETDKAVVAFEAQEECVLAAVLVEAGAAPVAVGTPIALTVLEAADVSAAQEKARQLKAGGGGGAGSAAAAAAARASSAAPAAAAATPAAPAAPAAANIPKVDTQDLQLPALSPTMETGSIKDWVKKTGDTIKPGDVICNIETDKAVVAFEAQEECILAAVLVEAGASPVKVGTPIALTVLESADLPAAQLKAQAIKAGAAGSAASAATTAAPAAAKPAPASAAAPAASAPAAAAAPAAPGPSFAHVGDLSPAVAFLVHSERLDASSIRGTGPKGRLLKGDVLAAIAAGTARKLPAGAAAAAATSGARPSASSASSSSSGPMPARGRGARTHSDVALSAAALARAQAVSAGKKGTPHEYLSAEVRVDALHAFVRAWRAKHAQPPPPPPPPKTTAPASAAAGGKAAAKAGGAAAAEAEASKAKAGGAAAAEAEASKAKAAAAAAAAEAEQTQLFTEALLAQFVGAALQRVLPAAAAASAPSAGVGRRSAVAGVTVALESSVLAGTRTFLEPAQRRSASEIVMRLSSSSSSSSSASSSASSSSGGGGAALLSVLGAGAKESTPVVEPGFLCAVSVGAPQLKLVMPSSSSTSSNSSTSSSSPVMPSVQSVSVVNVSVDASVIDSEQAARVLAAVRGFVEEPQSYLA